MQNRNWREYSESYKPLVDTGREEIELKKYPNDLDFHKTMGGTTYIVQSHFEKDAPECIAVKVARLALREQG